MKKKLRARGGFSLAEMLVAVAVLAFVAAAGAAVTSAVLSTRRDMIVAADASILGSTAAQAVADELRYGQNITVEGDAVTLDSAVFGTGATLKLNGDGRLVAVTEEEGADKEHMLLGEAAYAGLKLSELQFTKAVDDVTVKMTVGDGTQTLWQETFTVRAQNGLKP